MSSSRLRGFAAAAVVTLAAGFVVVAVAGSASAAVIPVGAGSYTTDNVGVVPGTGEQGCPGLSTNPRMYATANMPAGPIPTNDWWSSILWKKTNCAFGEPLHAHPQSYRALNSGLGFSYSTTPTISGAATGVGEYKYLYQQDLIAGVTGLNAPDVKVDGYSDWTVTPFWSDGARTVKATIGHGLPLTYFQVTGGNAQLTVTGGTPAVWSNTGSTVGFTVSGHDYVAYAPTGATWTVSGISITSTLNGRGYFSVATLPTTPSSSAAERSSLASTFGQYAHAHVTGTRLSYSYSPSTGTVTATYTFTTTAREGSATATVAALYPHQWRSLAGGTPLAQSYVSARGAMRVLAGITQFQTSMRYYGVVPEVPAVADGAGADLATLNGHLAAVQGNPMDVRNDDTYWTGKGLGRAARIAEIADQVNNIAVRDAALNAMKSRLNDWFTATPGKTTRVFAYNQTWGTLIGYPASYGSDEELNDHHFHYGYFIAAAATIAKFDPAWARTSRLRRHGRPADPRREQLRPRRHPVPVPA